MMCAHSSGTGGEQHLEWDNRGHYSPFLPFLAPAKLLSFPVRGGSEPGGAGGQRVRAGLRSRTCR